MYYQDYDDYMRNVLGYDTRNEAMADMNMPTYQMQNEYYQTTKEEMESMKSQEYEKLYPEIYKIVFPMVKKVCEENTLPISEEVLQQLTDNVYRNLEPETRSNTNVKMELKNGDVVNPNAKQEKREVKETRKAEPLRDLVQILILRELLGRSFRPRPPFPGSGVKPPFPRTDIQSSVQEAVPPMQEQIPFMPGMAVKQPIPKSETRYPYPRGINGF